MRSLLRGSEDKVVRSSCVCFSSSSLTTLSSVRPENSELNTVLMDPCSMERAKARSGMDKVKGR